MSEWPVADVGLSRRLEAAEGHAGVEFAEARATLDPGHGATSVRLGGVSAVYDGPDSPLTQTFGLGLYEPATEPLVDALETFFEERGAPVQHEVSPLADSSTWPLLHARGYALVELTTLLYRPLALATPPAHDAPSVRVAAPGEEDAWAALAAEGWSEHADLADFVRAMGRVMAERPGSALFFAEHEGRPIATATLALHEGVAFMAGASTTPDARGRGAQTALLAARLAYAAGHGCDLAAMGARPGSASQRNAERAGFRIAYTRLKWSKSSAAPA